MLVELVLDTTNRMQPEADGKKREKIELMFVVPNTLSNELSAQPIVKSLLSDLHDNHGPTLFCQSKDAHKHREQVELSDEQEGSKAENKLMRLEAVIKKKKLELKKMLDYVKRVAFVAQHSRQYVRIWPSTELIGKTDTFKKFEQSRHFKQLILLTLTISFFVPKQSSSSPLDTFIFDSCI